MIMLKWFLQIRNASRDAVNKSTDARHCLVDWLRDGERRACIEAEWRVVPSLQHLPGANRNGLTVERHPMTVVWDLARWKAGVTGLAG